MRVSIRILFLVSKAASELGHIYTLLYTYMRKKVHYRYLHLGLSGKSSPVLKLSSCGFLP